MNIDPGINQGREQDPPSESFVAAIITALACWAAIGFVLVTLFAKDMPK